MGRIRAWGRESRQRIKDISMLVRCISRVVVRGCTSAASNKACPSARKARYLIDPWMLLVVDVSL